MTTARLSALTPWCVAVSVVTLGVIWRDCVLAASSVLLLIQAFYASMENGKPWDSLRAAARCWLMATALLVAAASLAAWLMSAWLGWWSVGNDHPLSTLAVVACSVLILAQTQRSTAEATPTIALATLAAAAVAIILKELGVAYAPCMLAALASAVSVVIATRLAYRVAPDLLRCRTY